MAITRVTEHFDGRGCSESDNGELIYRRVFTVHSDVMDERVSNVRIAEDPQTAMRIPQIDAEVRDVHPEDITAICVSVEPQQRTDSPWLWTVNATYSTFGDPQNSNPLRRPAKAVFSQEDRQRPAEIGDRLKELAQWDEDVPVVNSAGDPFDPPIMIDEPRIVLTVTKNEAAYPYAKVKKFRKTVNADKWFIFDAGECKLQSVAASDSRVENGVRYREVTYTIHANHFVPWTSGPLAFRGGWNYILLDVGMNEILPTGEKKRIVSQIDGNQFGSMTPLNGEGQQLTKEEIVARDFKYRIYRFEKRVPWSGTDGLGLDSLVP